VGVIFITQEIYDSYAKYRAMKSFHFPEASVRLAILNSYATNQVTGANFRAGESQSLKNVIQAMNDSAAA
jgi:hypothetical protein